ncbi:MAG: hypothetical protein CMJ75_14740 [Planctomycetaceae bacterium]|nr:hypothetical protein [Planctomycetaceae bacterium]
MVQFRCPFVFRSRTDGGENLAGDARSCTDDFTGCQPTITDTEVLGTAWPIYRGAPIRPSLSAGRQAVKLAGIPGRSIDCQM